MPYVLYKLKSLTIPEMIVFIPTMLLKALLYIVIDKFDRSLMNVLFYTNYRGLSAEIKEDMAKTLLTSYFRPNLFPSAVLKLRELKSQGYRLVVVSGSLDFLVEPLAKELGFDDIMCATLEESNGHCTGRLVRFFPVLKYCSLLEFFFLDLFGIFLITFSRAYNSR